uniref:START domain-containing protein n=1 Tax=Phytophthora ramorum TaxID=164328 RepID=H3GZQ4_PHYRM
MSFLPQEGENIVTLQEALAFIETSGGINRDSATFPPLDEIDEFLGSIIEHSPEVVKSHERKTRKPQNTRQKKTTEKKKRVRSAASSSTVLQRRKKAEILSLREQATEMQNVLNQLLSHDENSRIPKLNAKTYADLKAQGQNLSRWHRCALEQYEMKCNSHQVNRQLKKFLSQQWNTSESLRRILQRQSLVQDMDYLMKHESPARFHASLANSDVGRCMAQLEDAVDNMFHHSASQFEVGSAPSLLSPAQTSYKEQRKGDLVEFIVSTPMTCSMADACDVIWNYLKQEQTPGSTPNALQMMVPWTVTHLEDTFQFEKLHYIRKFSEPEKITLVCSDILLLRSKGLKLCSKGYTTITPLPADPLHSCVVRSVLKLRVDSKADQLSDFATDVALGALSKAIRLFWQSEQTRLADEAVRISGESTGSHRIL